MHFCVQGSNGLRAIPVGPSSEHRQIAFDAVLQVRTSTGLRPKNFFGNFYMQDLMDVELGGLDSDKCICVEIAYDDELLEGEHTFIQAAVL